MLKRFVHTSMRVAFRELLFSGELTTDKIVGTAILVCPLVTTIT